MTTYDVAVVGTDVAGQGAAGDGRDAAVRHAEAFGALDDCRIVGCATHGRGPDERERGRHGGRRRIDDGTGAAGGDPAALADVLDVPAHAAYGDYTELVAAHEPDVLSVCTPPSAHTDVVVGAAESGGVDAVHCAGQLAATWAGARELAAVCRAREVQLTVDHARRFAEPVRVAKRRLDTGAIGALRRVEYAPADGCGGTDGIDCCTYLNDDHPAQWVQGQAGDVDRLSDGGHRDAGTVACWEYENGVFGLAASGRAAGLADADLRLVGTTGRIDVTLADDAAVDVYAADADESASLSFADPAPETAPAAIAAAEAIQALDDGRPPAVGAANALTATEIVFAGYESVRRRGRVDLPLDVTVDPRRALSTGADRSPAADRSRDDRSSADDD